MSEPGLQQLLAPVVEALTDAAIPYMLVGSFASMVHGELRATHDIDIVIDPTRQQLEQLLERLPADRFYADADVARDALRRRTMFNVIDTHTGWKLDLIVRKARPFSVEELERRQPAVLAGVALFTASAEDTIIAKLEWGKSGGSERQLEDVAGILRVRAGSLDLDYIERWVAELDLREEWQRARTL